MFQDKPKSHHKFLDHIPKFLTIALIIFVTVWPESKMQGQFSISHSRTSWLYWNNYHGYSAQYIYKSLLLMVIIHGDYSFILRKLFTLNILNWLNWHSKHSRIWKAWDQLITHDWKDSSLAFRERLIWCTGIGMLNAKCQYLTWSSLINCERQNHDHQ